MQTGIPIRSRPVTSAIRVRPTAAKWGEITRNVSTGSRYRWVPPRYRLTTGDFGRNTSPREAGISNPRPNSHVSDGNVRLRDTGVPRTARNRQAGLRVVAAAVENERLLVIDGGGKSLGSLAGCACPGRSPGKAAASAGLRPNISRLAVGAAIQGATGVQPQSLAINRRVVDLPDHAGVHQPAPARYHSIGSGRRSSHPVPNSRSKSAGSMTLHGDAIEALVELEAERPV